ncbi:MAG TPA: VOC family protein [Chloroflexota bacterium]
MAPILGLAEIVLWVHDLDRALHFYRDVLGLEPINPPDHPHPVFLQAGPPQAGVPQLVVLVRLPEDAPPFSAPRALHHLALTVAPEDFDPLRERLERQGYTLRGGQHPVLPSRTMYVDDPEGNEVEIICRA